MTSFCKSVHIFLKVLFLKKSVLTGSSVRVDLNRTFNCLDPNSFFLKKEKYIFPKDFCFYLFLKDSSNAELDVVQ